MDAVCFDTDGVLVDSEDYLVPYEAGELFPRLGLDDLDVDGITGMNYREIYESLVETCEVEMARADFVADLPASLREHLLARADGSA